MLKVFIVDDHDLVRLGIRGIIDNVGDIKVVGEADSGEEAMKLIKTTKPDIVLMDIKMPGMGGLEATRQLLQKPQDYKIIILTTCDQEPYPSRLLQAGAAGYITKDCTAEEMIGAIRKVYAGQRYMAPRVAQQIALKHLSDGGSESPFDILSERELQVLIMITKGAKVADIAKQMGLSTKTVNTYRYRLFAKLKVNSDVELMHLALRYNLVD